jgi:addiction module RelE/StbE family toxin
MAAPEKLSQAEWELADGFKESWKKAKERNPSIAEAMWEFDRCKRAHPPIQLPKKMNDHKLDGPLRGYYDCHLAHDVILIYKPLGNGVCKLITICDHSDLRGPKAKVLVDKLK